MKREPRREGGVPTSPAGRGGSILGIPGSRRLIVVLLAVTAGGLWGLCFERTTSPLIGFFGLTPLILLLARRAPRQSPTSPVVAPVSARLAFVVGWIHGVSSWWVQVPWIGSTVHEHGGLPLWLSLIVLLLLTMYLGLYHALFALFSRLVLPRPGVAMLAVPACWVGLEWLRSHLISGFAWNLAGYAWVELPGALPVAAVIGAYGVSFLVVCVNLAWALAWLTRRARYLILAPVVMLMLGAAIGWSAMTDPESASEAVSVRIVQPNTPVLTDAASEEILANYRGLFEIATCPAPGTLVILPESAAWPFAWERHPQLRSDLERIAAAGCTVLFNTPMWEDDRVYNVAALLDADTVEIGSDVVELSTYRKKHLVPFGEYVPFASVLPFVESLARASGSFSAADEVELLPWRDLVIGVSICFEITAPGEVAQRVRLGADTLVTLTNDAWFGDTSAPWQHLTAARFRAAENHRPVLRAAITGISTVIDPRGRTVGLLDVGERGVLDAKVVPSRRSTVYSRAPWLVPALCSGLTIAVCVAHWRRIRYGDGRGESAAG